MRAEKQVSDTRHTYRLDLSNRATLGGYGNFDSPRNFGIELRATYPVFGPHNETGRAILACLLRSEWPSTAWR